MNRYEKLLRWVLKGKRPVWAFVSLFGVFILSICLLDDDEEIRQTFFQAVIRILYMCI